MTVRLKAIEAGALFRQRLWSRERGEAFLRVLGEADPDLVPETYGRHEPVKTLFDASDLSGPLAGWGGAFLWRRRRPRVRGHYVRGPVSAHDAVYLSLPATAASAEKAVAFLAALEGAFGLDFGYVHIRHALETAEPERYLRFTMPFSLGVTTHDLREGLPDLPWATFLGPPYVELLGRERIATAPASSVRDLGRCTVLILTAGIAPGAAFESELTETRDKVKEHLGGHAFRADGRQVVPAHFELEPA